MADSDTERTVPCAICGTTVRPETERIEIVEDEGALYSGYHTDLDDEPPAEDKWCVCEGCADRLGQTGRMYRLIVPEYPDDPPAGGVNIYRAAMWNRVITDCNAGAPDGGVAFDHGGPVYRVVRAWDRGEEMDATPWRHYRGVADDAETFEEVAGGWHDSIFPSDMSEAIRAIQTGERAYEGPVAVRVAETTNVCSTSVAVRAPPRIAAEIRDDLRDHTSRPGGATRVRE